MNFAKYIAALNYFKQGTVFFVEIGAMDGVKFDGLHSYIVDNPNWTGLLVEPLPDMYGRLKENYKGRTNLSFENAAIAETDGHAQITRVMTQTIEKEGLPEWLEGAATMAPERHIVGRYDYVKPHVTTETIRTLSFATFMKKHAITNIDLIQIDTEGYDKIIFDQLWVSGIRPLVIKMEVLHITYMEILELMRLLGSNGYSAEIEGDDLVAANSSIIST